MKILSFVLGIAVLAIGWGTFLYMGYDYAWYGIITDSNRVVTAFVLAILLSPVGISAIIFGVD